MTENNPSQSTSPNGSSQDIFSITAYKLLRACTSDDIVAATLDPLECDSFFATEFALLNEHNEINLLCSQANRSAHTALTMKGLARLEALAALRDLGMMGAAVTRLNGSLAPAPELSPALLSLSSIADEVPRDTVFSYSLHNPHGERERRFTTLGEESLFITSVRNGILMCIECIEWLCIALASSPRNRDFASAIDSASRAFDKMIEYIVAVRKSVSPEVFTFRLRPFFDPYEVGGQVYFAPGGAQMPILIIDVLVWADPQRDEEYGAYFTHNSRYLTTPLRQFASNLLSKRHLVDMIKHEYMADPSDHCIIAAAQSLKRLLAKLISFRRIHFGIAAQNFKIRAPDASGSGGYNLDILDRLLRKTTDVQQLIRNMR